MLLERLPTTSEDFELLLQCSKKTLRNTIYKSKFYSQEDNKVNKAINTVVAHAMQTKQLLLSMRRWIKTQPRM